MTGKKIRQWIVRGMLLYLVYALGGCVLVPLYHKKSDGSNAALPLQNGKTSDERIRCIDDNREALLWRLRVIEEAKEEIVLTTFDMRDDNSGKEIMAALIGAANRGVQVKVMADGINAFLHLRNNRYFHALAATQNVEIKIYNPVNFLFPWKLNYRMHDKYVIADDSVYILGGRNTNDLFLGDYRKSYNIDRDILVYETGRNGQNQTETSMAKLRNYFDKIWNLSCNRLVSDDKDGLDTKEAKELEQLSAALKEKWPEAYEKFDWEKETLSCEGITLLTNPCEAVNKEPVLWADLCKIMEKGQDILIETPYIICGRDMYDGLTTINGKSSVRIITNAVESGANPSGCTDYLNQKNKILCTGSEVYECLAGQSVHTKTILVDEDISIVGSYNLDMRSTYLDTEMMLVIRSRELNENLRLQAQSAMDLSKHVIGDGTEEYGKNYEPEEMSFGKKCIYGILRILTYPVRQVL